MNTKNDTKTPKTPKAPKETKKPKAPPTQLERFMGEHEADHYNGLPEIIYKVSTGSLNLDCALDGGLGSGIHRFGGSSEGGKTSCALEVAKNFLETIPNSKVLYIKAEGRLSRKVKERSMMKFVEAPHEWAVGTAFCYKSNIFDSLAQLIFSLVTDNPDGIKYCIIIDSLDGLILKDDLAKEFDKGEHVKVAGPNVLTKRLMKQTSLPISEYGHMLILVAQVIGKIKNKYDSPDQLNVGGGGGNAAIHFSNWILEFLPRFNKDKILNGVSKKVVSDFDETNVVGHNCLVKIIKSENETSDLKLSYPIKYGRSKDGEKTGSIWNELELKDSLEREGLVVSKGAWTTFQPKAVRFMEKSLEGVEIKAAHNGGKKFMEYISENREVLDLWVNYLKLENMKEKLRVPAGEESELF